MCLTEFKCFHKNTPEVKSIFEDKTIEHSQETVLYGKLIKMITNCAVYFRSLPSQG